MLFNLILSFYVLGRLEHRRGILRGKNQSLLFRTQQIKKNSLGLLLFFRMSSVIQLQCIQVCYLQYIAIFHSSEINSKVPLFSLVVK